jgi:putative serine protease PepD
MSDRFDDPDLQRVSEPTAEAPHQPESGPATAEQRADGVERPVPTAWAVPLGGQPEPVAVSPIGWATPAWSDPVTDERPLSWASPSGDSPGGTSSSDRGGRGDGLRGRSWLLVAIVAALIGGLVGAGVTALANNSGSSTTTIKENSGAPGAAIDNGANIPQLVDRLLPAVVSIEVTTPQEEEEGSGMIISPDGMVVTNYHVIALAATGGGVLTVTESGSAIAEKATLVGTDQTDDVALLHITGASNLKTVTFGDSDKAVIGDAVVAIGNALGLSQGSPTVTQGIISALGRTVTAGDSGSDTETLSDLIQTDAAINPGNSGGPLVDSAGDVIGMDTAVAGATGDGTDAQNIGFAIPSAQIETLLPGLEKGGTPTKTPGYMGVDIETLTPQLRSEYGLTAKSGALVLDVVPGSPASLAGIGQEDVIVGVNATAITSAADLQSAIAGFQAGQSIKVAYYRGDLEKTTTLTLISQSALQTLENQSDDGQGGSGSSGGGLTSP